MYQRSVLDNGLRVLTSSMPHTRSVSIAFFVGAGSRHEPDSIAGVSHFLEHMLFKGTARRPSPLEVAEEIEGVGGVINAATDKELTVFYAKVGHQHFDTALDVLCDTLRFSLLDPIELEKERHVVIEELAMSEDSPAELVAMLTDEMLWPDHPLGRDVGGSKESVASLKRDDLTRYIGQYYVPNNTVLAVAGNVTHEQVMNSVATLLSDWVPGEQATWQPATIRGTRPEVRLRAKKTEQAHVAYAIPALSGMDPDRFALDVLNTVLGDGMSSRLFLQIREQLGLAYDVHSYVCRFQDDGALIVGAGVHPKQLGPTMKAIRRELRGIRERVPDRELTKARRYITGRVQLRMEDTGAVASWLGRQELLRGSVYTVDDVVEIIDGITADDLVRVADRVFAPDRGQLAVVGPFRSEERLATLVA
ncbi:MAG TPA: pitrilysin family protein [Chloroflexota bacterium]|nr:pitrilysin family protein [Chloroflexota bacterium]